MNCSYIGYAYRTTLQATGCMPACTSSTFSCFTSFLMSKQLEREVCAGKPNNKNIHCIFRQSFHHPTLSNAVVS